MPFSVDLERQFYDGLQASPVTPPGIETDYMTQFGRGLVRGGTMGLIDPGSGQPHGGLAETAGDIVGTGATFFVPLRLAGLGAAGLRMLKPGMSGAKAASELMFTGPGALGRSLSGAGQIAANVGAGALTTAMPMLMDEARGDGTQTLKEGLIHTALGAGLSGVGAGWLARRAGRKALTDAVGDVAPAAASTLLPAMTEQLGKIDAEIVTLSRELLSAKGLARKAAKERMGKLQTLREQLLSDAPGALVRPPGATEGGYLDKTLTPEPQPAPYRPVHATSFDDLQRQMLAGTGKTGRLLGEDAVQGQPAVADWMARVRGEGVPKYEGSLIQSLQTGERVLPGTGGGPMVSRTLGDDLLHHGPQPMGRELIGGAGATSLPGVKPPPVALPSGPMDRIGQGLVQSEAQADMLLKAAGVTDLGTKSGPEKIAMAEALLGRRRLGPAATDEYGAVLPHASVNIGGGLPPGATPVANPLIEANAERVLQNYRGEPIAVKTGDWIRTDPQQVVRAAEQIRTPRPISGGSDAVLPPEMDVMARVVAGAPFPEVRKFEPLLASGFAGALRTINAKMQGLSIIPPKAVFSGTPVEGIVELLETTNNLGLRAAEEVLDRFKVVSLWTPTQRQRFQTLASKYAQDRPGFFEAVQREMPELRTQAEHVLGVFDQLRVQGVLDGVLDPKQRFATYLPLYRDRRVAKGSQVVEIEMGDEYVPSSIQRMVSNYKPGYAKKRVILDEDLAPHKIDLLDSMRLYATQFGRAHAMSEAMPEIQALIAKTPPELVEYTKDYLNHWMGKTGVETVSKGLAELRRFQFLRTIGFNPLSAITNTFQRINTFAVVHPGSFMQAFADMRDPERVAIALKNGVGVDPLAKVFEDAERIGTGPVSKWYDTMSQKMGALFSYSEKQNKIHAFLAGMREAERRGVADEAGQIQKGLQVMYDTQFVHSSANAPVAFRTDIGRTVGQFQNFRLNQAHFMGRLVDEAVNKGNPGPMIRFLAPQVILGGASILPGDWSSTAQVQTTMSKLAQGGTMELLFGVSLGHQLGAGTIGAEDMQSFLYYLPGPTASWLMGLASAFSGKSLRLGDGGRELSYQERVSQLAQTIPAGVTANRLLAGLRLLQNDGHYRESLDLSQALGGSPGTGDLMAKTVLDGEHILLAAMGFQPTERERERNQVQRQKQLEKDYSAAEEQAATLLTGGKTAEAAQVMKDFSRKYQDILPHPVLDISPSSQKAALLRKVMPPGRRKELPSDLRGALLYSTEEGR